MEKNVGSGDKELALRCKKYKLIAQVKRSAVADRSLIDFKNRLFTDPEVPASYLMPND